MATLLAERRAVQSFPVTREEAARLVREARAGDADAWARLVAGYERLVLAIAFNFRMRREDAEDVRQTVFFRLAQHLDRLRDPESVGSWIASVARNECLALIRNTKPTTSTDALDDVAVDADPVDNVLARESSVELWRAFARLGPDCQALLTMRVLNDPQPSYEEISVALDIPIGSIGPTRRRCLDKLKQAIVKVDR